MNPNEYVCTYVYLFINIMGFILIAPKIAGKERKIMEWKKSKHLLRRSVFELIWLLWLQLWLWYYYCIIIMIYGTSDCSALYSVKIKRCVPFFNCFLFFWVCLLMELSPSDFSMFHFSIIVLLCYWLLQYIY
jgi:hypothetical protein